MASDANFSLLIAGRIYRVEKKSVSESVSAQLPHELSMGKSHNTEVSDFMNLAFSS